MGVLPLIIMLVWRAIQMSVCMVPASGQAEAKDRKMPGMQMANAAVVTTRQPRGKSLGSEGNTRRNGECGRHAGYMSQGAAQYEPP